MKYLPDSQEYPDYDDVILPLGENWNYVNSTFANGFINVGKPLAACVINRYSGDEGREVEYSMRPPDRKLGWQKVKIGQPEDAIALFQAGWTSYHTKLDMFRDDVLLLTLCDKTYYWFWLDMDVSDCSVGRFRTDDPVEQVIAHFHEDAAECAKRARNTDSDRPDLWTLQPSWLEGWKSW